MHLKTVVESVGKLIESEKVAGHILPSAHIYAPEDQVEAEGEQQEANDDLAAGQEDKKAADDDEKKAFNL